MVLASLVEGHFSDLIPNKFAIAFDGWTICSTHYMTLFASFTKEYRWLKEVLQAIVPLLCEETLGALQID